MAANKSVCIPALDLGVRWGAVYFIPTWLIAGTVCLLILASLRLGHGLGAKGPSLSDDANAALGMVKASVFGLLGLILAFSFSIASDRYDARRRLVMEEANALGTAYLRAELLSASLRQNYRTELRGYADARLDFVTAGIDEGQIATTDARVAEHQKKLWAMASAEARDNPDDVHASVIESLNSLFDVTAARNVARQAEVPPPIMILLIILVCVSAMFAGHSFGTARHREIMTSLCFSIIISAVLFAILDLERPRRGFIRENEQPMQAARAAMQP